MLLLNFPDRESDSGYGELAHISQMFQHMVQFDHLQVRPLQINFLFPVYRPHPQAGSRCGPIILLMMSHIP